MTARRWNEGGSDVTLEPRPGEPVTGMRTWGRHPALFVYSPVALWRALGREYDVIDIQEEPFALATAEILLLRRLRRQRAPYVLYSAQNIEKRYPVPFRWLERWALRNAAGISVCNAEAGRICERKGLPGRATVIPLGVDTDHFSPARAHARARETGHRRVRRPAGAPQGRRRAAGRRGPRSTPSCCGSPAPDRTRTSCEHAAEASPARPTGSSFVGSLDAGTASRLLPRPRRRWPCRRCRPPAGSSSSAGSPSRRWRAASRSSPATPARCPTSSADAGLLVPPGDPRPWPRPRAAATWADPRRAWSRRGLERARACSWPAVAAAYLDLYRGRPTRHQVASEASRWSWSPTATRPPRACARARALAPRDRRRQLLVARGGGRL